MQRNATQKQALGRLRKNQRPSVVVFAEGLLGPAPAEKPLLSQAQRGPLSAQASVLSAAARSKVVAGVSVMVKAVDCRDLAEAAVVPVFNAKSGAKSRQVVVGLFRKANKAFWDRHGCCRGDRHQASTSGAPAPKRLDDSPPHPVNPIGKNMVRGCLANSSDSSKASSTSLACPCARRAVRAPLPGMSHSPGV